MPRLPGVVLALLVGCSPEVDRGPGVTAREIIGGFAAISPTLNAIGAIAHNYPDGFRVYCSGTLVGPRVVLTAQHCTFDRYDDDVFLVGPDPANPARVVPIVADSVEDSIEGGYLGIGSDVAVMHLGADVDDVPLPGLGCAAAGEVGDTFVVAGYGVQDNHDQKGTRRMGSTTLRGLDGKHLQNLFATREELALDLAAAYGDELDADVVTSWWEDYELLDGYDASFGYAVGDVQDCYGDSGGPYLRSVGGELQVVGVVSYGPSSPRLVCDWGGVGAILGPAAIELVSREIACPRIPDGGRCEGSTLLRCSPDPEGVLHTIPIDCAGAGLICSESGGHAECVPDPCAGLPYGGQCEGTIAVRCSREGEGPHRKVSVDCAVLGLGCALEKGEATCL